METDKNASQNRIPADFLINKFLFVEEAHYGEHLNDHISIEKIKMFVGY